MIYNCDANLNRFQRIERFLVSPPKSSFTSFAFEKIHHYEVNRYLMYSDVHVEVMTRVYALAIPILALLDFFRFAGETLYRIITMKNGKLDSLYKCAKSFKVFLIMIPLWFPSIIAPTSFVKGDTKWKKIQREQTFARMAHSISSLDDVDQIRKKFRETLEHEIRQYIFDSTTHDFFLQLIDQVAQSLPQNQEGIKPVAYNHLDIFSLLLTEVANGQISFQEEERQRTFLPFFQELLQIRDFEFKEKMLIHALNHHNEWKVWSQPIVSLKPEESKQEQQSKNSQRKNSLLFLFLARTLTDDEELLEKLFHVFSTKTFYPPVNRRSFFMLLLNIHSQGFSKEENKCFLKKITELHTSQEVSSSTSNATRLKKMQEDLKKKQNSLEKTNKRLQKESNERQLSLIRISKEKLETDITMLHKEIATLQESLGETVGHLTTTERPKPDMIRGIQNLSILLLLPSRKRILQILHTIHQNKTSNEGYFYLSDEKIISDLIKSVFNFDEQISLNLKNFSHLRSYYAFLMFNLQLRKYQGKDREAVLQKSREVFISVLRGTYREDRFNETHNPHLQRIFAGRDDLRKAWTSQHKPASVRELLPQTASHFGNYEISIAEDPADIILIGDDLGTCVSVKNGRPNKMPGLLGFLADGKTQTIIAKENKNSPVVAETQLQIMWDSENKTPVLLLEEINYRGKKDNTLQQAVIKYAQRLAKEMKLPLVSQYPNGDGSLLKRKYPGFVKSLGSSSPIEFVNFYHEVRGGKYDVGRCYLISSNTTKTTQLFSCRQLHGNGRINKEKVYRIVEELNQNRVTGVFFNRERVSGFVRGGICTSLSFDFAVRIMPLYQRGVSISTMIESVKTWKRLYETGRAANTSEKQNHQEAFNAIEVEQNVSVDISRNKMVAIAKYYNMQITMASSEFNVMTDPQSKIIKIVQELSNGIYLLRVLKPKNNHKQEKEGHSLILVKKEDRAILYDSSDTVGYVKSRYLGDFVYAQLRKCWKKWGVHNARFYLLKSSTQETSHDSHY